jgi:hypothetical protein
MANIVRAENGGVLLFKRLTLYPHIYHEGSYVLISVTTLNLHPQDISVFAFFLNDNRFILNTYHYAQHGPDKCKLHLRPHIK